MAHRAAERGLYRAGEGEACLGGVCAGIAQRFEFDPLAVRLMALALAVVTLGLAAVAYAVMWAVLPQAPGGGQVCEAKLEQAESSAYGFLDLDDPLAGSSDSGEARFSLIVRIAVVACLAVLFLLVAHSVTPLIDGSHWWQFWPAAFVIAGVILIIIPVQSSRQACWQAIGVTLSALAISSLPMSLGIMSWMTFAEGLRQLWPLAIGAVVLFGLGVKRSSGALAIGAALLVVMFCLLMLSSCALPGDVAHLMVNMPGGRSLRIALSQAIFAL